MTDAESTSRPSGNAPESLQTISADLDNLVSSAGVAALFLDEALRIRRLTPAAGLLFRCGPADIGRPLADLEWKFADAPLLSDARRVLEQSLALEAEVRVAETGRWYRRSAAPYRGHDGRTVGVVVSFADITACRTADERLRALMGAVPIGAILVDFDGRILLANERTERYFGYSGEELVGQPLSLLMRDVADLMAAPHGTRVERDLTATRSDGSSFTAHLGLVAAVSPQGPALVTLVDAAEREDQALREAKEEAERANRAKSRFLSAVSHDLRQPLQTLSLLNSVLAQRVSDGDTRHMVERQGEAVAAMRDQLNLFMDLARLDRGAISPEVRDFPIGDLIRKLSREFEPLAAARGIGLRFVSCSAVLHSDPALLYRIVQNLLSNAVRYTEAGRVVVGCRRRGERLRIEVWDTGPGVPADRLRTIFEEFVQLSNPARQADKGYGLGLSVAKNLAGVLNIGLDVRSRPGRGSVFSVEIPRAHPAAAGLPAEATAPRGYRGPPGARVLLVEDDPIVRSATRTALAAIGLQVSVAANADEALAQLRVGDVPPALIVADYRLPGGLSGVEMVRTIRSASGREVPALLVTGDTSANSIGHMRASGLRILYKPVEGGDLLEAINALLGGDDE